MRNKIFSNEKSKKIFISIIFGLIGFTINMFPIRIYSYQGINVDIIIGLIFPLFITVVWGWKYGLISALCGGCQAMWFLWYQDGYGMLYSVPVYTLWIVWHGLLSNQRKKEKEKRWYHSIYFTEIIFRIIIEIGFLTLFVWLISKNPPFWDTSIQTTQVTKEWLNAAILKHIFLSLLFLFIVQMVLHIKIVRKIFNIESPFLEGDSIMVGSLLFSALLIVLEAIGCTLFSQNNLNHFLQNIFINSENQIYIRVIMVFSSLLAGLIIFILYNKITVQRNKTQEILKLTQRLGNESNELLNRDTFLSDLLKTAYDIIDESDCGEVYVYEDKYAKIIDEIGHNEKIKGIKIKSFIDIKKSSNIYILHRAKQIFLNKVEPQQIQTVNKYMRLSNESLVMIFSFNGEKIAGLVLNKIKGSFSKESINLFKTLKNIPATYFTQIYSFQEKNALFESIIYSIIKILSLHNDYTKKHSLNVAEIAAGIAKKMGLNKNIIDTVYWTGLVHDIGKILIPESILNKKEKLTKEEWETIKKHPVWGYETLNDNKNLKEIAEYVLYHHEQWTGSGYPKGITGKNIPLISRIISVADTYDAMTNERPYRKALSKQTALKEIMDNSGTQFDPEIVKIFVDNFDKIIIENKTK